MEVHGRYLTSRLAAAAFCLILVTPCAPAAEEQVAVKKFTVNAGTNTEPFPENTYVLYHKASLDAVLVDPGAPDKRIADFISQTHLIVRTILNTHGHSDHTRANRFFANTYGVKIRGPWKDRDLYEDAENKPDEWLKEETTIMFGSLGIRILATPGHTPGSLCFLAEENLLSGDTLFAGSIGKSFGETEEQKRENEKLEISSIRLKLLPLDATTWVWPGHGALTTIWDEASANPFLRDRNQALF
ncbi:MAG: MBL fold metallo-hydrolase [Candidatus Aminicenantes bacterium]|jgi:hydroxyacylglutathione hydrolase|nr:MBL fold metallo-hydrolase [Candidatus Aminicenantes bacterium]